MSPNRAGVVAAAVVLPACGTLAVGLRLYVRRLKRQELGVDDWTIVVGLILVWMLGAVLIWGAAIKSIGTHSVTDPVTGAYHQTVRDQNSVKLGYPYFMILSAALGVIKISIILLYRRLFVGKYFNWYSIAVIITLALWSLAFLFVWLFQCGTRIWAAWTSVQTLKKYCFNVAAPEIAWAVTDIATDLIVLSTPIPLILKLHMTRSKKAGLCAVFLLGTLSTAAGCARLASYVIDVYPSVIDYRDLIGINTNVRVWSLVEAGVAVVAACLPTLGPFITEKGSSSVVDSVRSVLRLGSNSRARATRNETDRERLTFIPSSTSANLHNMLSFQNVVTSISQEDELPNVPESQIMMHCMITQDVEQAV